MAAKSQVANKSSKKKLKKLKHILFLEKVAVIQCEDKDISSEFQV
jgi:hypothetical protein